MNGILLVDKPAGWTSFDVVAKVRGVVRRMPPATTHLPNASPRKVKVGHIGTLDPLATGLLVLMLGAYTKKVPEYTKLDKTYEVVMRLGQTSTTGDEEGVKKAVSTAVPTKEELHIACARFEGDSLQTPPAYSAIKINGQRAYDLARKGQAPTLQPRPVHIDRIMLTAYVYPDVRFVTHVSSGTYIRSLVEDIGKALGTGAYMAHLRRTRIGPFRIEDAAPVERITAEALPQLLRTDIVIS